MSLIAVIEMPAGTRFKYEVNKNSGALRLDRILNQPIPHNYGYFPNTLEEDSDPIDVFVLSNTPIYPLTEVPVELIGVLRCEDNGVSDNKLLAVIPGDTIYGDHGTAVIERYLETYKEGFKILGRGGKEEALKIYEDSVKLHNYSV